jgi:uncharacterized protein (TIGR04141 family)
MSESIQIGIFRLRSEIEELDKNHSLFTTEVDVDMLTSRFKKEGYKQQKLKTLVLDGYKLYLFYKRWPSSIKWKEFIKTIADSKSQIIKNPNSSNEGYVLLIETPKSKTLYALAGGFGHIQLQEYTDNEFGLDVLSRLIKADDKVLKAVKEKNFIGGVLGSIKFFRGDYNFNENENFGNFYQELKAKLNLEILRKTFGFNPTELKKKESFCVAKSSFTIRKSITINKALSIIGRLDTLLTKKPVIDFNLVKRLAKSDKSLIDKLNLQLKTTLYDIFRSKPVDNNIEICHKEFDKYLVADIYEVSFSVKNNRYHDEHVKQLENFKDLIQVYLKHSNKIIDFKSFEETLNSTTIISKNEDNSNPTKGTLFEHICAELRVDKISYFLINKEWYHIKSEFEKQLNEQCQSFVNNHSANKLLKPWNVTDSENAFNARHIGQKETLVFDKITPENIEVCDILKWTKDAVYLIHVKKGFDNEMRNLCRQIQIAARRLQDDAKTGGSFLENHYETLASSKGISPYIVKARKQLDHFSQDEYTAIFDPKNKRKLVFVLAILDSAIKKRSFKKISEYDSNIAKFCLQKLVIDMRQLDIELQILQISRPLKY